MLIYICPSGEDIEKCYKIVMEIYSTLGFLIKVYENLCVCVCVCVSIQVLEVLWELAHLPTLPTSLVQQALEEHLGILSDAYAVKEAVKRSYIIKCIEDIKKVRQMLQLFSFIYVVMGQGYWLV